jgi:hypothetical protein
MAAHPLFQKVKATVGEWIDAIQGKPKPEHPLVRYGTPVLFTLLALAALSAIYVGYRWYATSKEQHAQYACSLLIDEYMNLQKQETPDYTSFTQKATASYAQYKGTAVAPYIGLLTVDAYIKNGNQVQAIEVMNTLVDATAENTIVGDLFKTKQALLMIDSTDDMQKEEGLKRLAMLADNSENPHRDYALYHLGLYHWNRNDLVAARSPWQELVESQEVELRAPSPWAEVVAEKLSTIPA